MSGPPFATTRWSVVLAAGGAANGARRAALEELFGAYWQPLYAYLRRDGHGADDAADLVQGFFASLLERDSLARVQREGGRFRSWLLVALRHHARDERRREHAEKRGGGRAPLALDVAGAEARFSRADEREPEALFHRRWAETVLERALARLREEHAARGRQACFDELEPALRGDGALDRAAAADALGLTPVALRVAVHRLRERYRRLVVEEVRDTLGPGVDPGDELAELFAALR